MSRNALYDLILVELRGRFPPSPAIVGASDALSTTFEARIEDERVSAGRSADRDWVDVLKEAISDAELRGSIYMKLNQRRIAADQARLKTIPR